jgi:hypothetical protein
MRNAAIEVEIREEVAQEMQAAMARMADDHAKRFQDQVCKWVAKSQAALTRTGGSERDEDGPQA